jgi:hypothetical protein
MNAPSMWVTTDQRLSAWRCYDVAEREINATVAVSSISGARSLAGIAASASSSTHYLSTIPLSAAESFAARDRPLYNAARMPGCRRRRLSERRRQIVADVVTYGAVFGCYR